jgi:hypothetical protein
MNLTDAMELNRNAIDLIQTGFESEAMRLLGSSELNYINLQPTDEWNDNNECQESQEGGDGGNCDTVTSSTGSQQRQSSIPFAVVSVPTDDFMSTSLFASGNRPPEPPHSFFTIYNRAFEFHLTNPLVPASRMTRAVWFQCATNVPAVILFNAGLACHILAVWETSKDLFEMALVFYNTSYRMLSDQILLRVYVDEMDILHMALANNMGHCHARLENTDQMTRCYNDLCIIYLTTKQKHLLSSEEQAFFWNRIAAGVGFWQQPAAAA